MFQKFCKKSLNRESAEMDITFELKPIIPGQSTIACWNSGQLDHTVNLGAPSKRLFRSLQNPTNYRLCVWFVD